MSTWYALQEHKTTQLGNLIRKIKLCNQIILAPMVRQKSSWNFAPCTEKIPFQDRKNHDGLADSCQDSTRLAPPGNQAIFSRFRGEYLTQKAWRKKRKSHWRIFKKSNGDGSLKLQISVPCRGRTRPDPFWGFPESGSRGGVNLNDWGRARTCRNN